jgi:hypothetical protein
MVGTKHNRQQLFEFDKIWPANREKSEGCSTQQYREAFCKEFNLNPVHCAFWHGDTTENALKQPQNCQNPLSENLLIRSCKRCQECFGLKTVDYMWHHTSLFAYIHLRQAVALRGIHFRNS